MSSIHLKNRPTNRLLSFEQRKASCLLPLTEALLSSPQQCLSAMCRSSHALAPLQPRGQVVSPLRSADHVHRRPTRIGSQWHERQSAAGHLPPELDVARFIRGMLRVSQPASRNARFQASWWSMQALESAGAPTGQPNLRRLSAPTAELEGESPGADVQAQMPAGAQWQPQRMWPGGEGSSVDQ